VAPTSMSLRQDDIQEAPPSKQNETSRGPKLLYVHKSHTLEPTPPLAGIERRKLDLKSPPGAIPNLGAGHEIKPQPRFAFAMWTCGLASQPTCPDRASRGQRAARLKRSGFEQLERREEDDKRKTKPETRKRSALLLSDIRFDRRHAGLERSSLLYFVSGRHGRCNLRIRCRCALNHHSPATTQGIQQGVGAWGAEYWPFCGIRGLRSRRAQRDRSAPRSGPGGGGRGEGGARAFPPLAAAASAHPNGRASICTPNCELS
jgi:hypothetical protein